MSAKHDWFHDFMKLQPTLIESTHSKKETTKPTKLVKPKVPQVAEQLSLPYIVEKKPSGKKVMAYLQKLIDDIVAEND
jgi:hypothetical protein